MKNNETKVSFDCLCIEITRRCNMACPHCLRGDAQEIDITHEIIDKALENVTSINSITFTGGEPSLNVEAMQYILNKCKNEGIFVSSFYIVTNGKVVSVDFIKTMLDWYAFCIENGGEGELCGLALSRDRFHETIPVKNELLLRGLTFFNEDKFQKEDNSWVIAEGKGANLNGARKLDVECIPDISLCDHDDYKEAILDGIIYVSADGKVIAGCDWSFDNQKNHQIGTVYKQSDWLKALGL